MVMDRLSDRVPVEWSGEIALADLEVERTLKPEETLIELGNKDLREAYPAVCRSVIQLALHASNERVRGTYATYVIDKVNSLEQLKGGDPLLNFINEVSDFANSTYKPESEQ